jgi:hypothetical protein
MGPNTNREVPLTNAQDTSSARAEGKSSPLQTGSAPVKKLPALRRAGSIAVRLVLIGGVLWLGWNTLTSFAELFSGPQPVEKIDSLPQPPVHPPSLSDALLALPSQGPWVFAGQPWQVRIGQVTAEHRREHLHQPPAHDIHDISGTKASDGERSLLQLIKLMGGVPVRQGPNGLYCLLQSDFEAVVFTRQLGDQERVLAGRVALPDSPGKWRIVELVPAPAPVAAARRDAPSLLPLPSEAQCLAKRLDEQGTVLCELVSVNHTMAQVEEGWRQNGWRVLPCPGSSPPGSPWYCQRGPDAVQAWGRAADPKSRRLVFLLIRLTPSGSARGLMPTVE